MLLILYPFLFVVVVVCSFLSRFRTLSNCKALFKLGKDNFGYGTGRLILQAIDPSIGIGSEDTISQQSIKLQAGDKILLYTDGLLENRNSAGVFFGKQRFYDNLKNISKKKL